MKIAYFTNQYPKVSHTFIRREIAALEARGMQIERLSIRPTPDTLIDEADIAENARTVVLLDKGIASLLMTLIMTALGRPLRFARAFKMALKMGLRSQRGLGRHLADLLTASALLAETQRRQCTHIHVHFGTNPAGVALLARLLGGPSYSFTVHGPEEFDKPGELSLGDKIAHCAFVAGVSSFGRSQLYRHCDLSHWDKVKIVRCGVDDTYLTHTPTQVPSVDRLVCVGRLCEQKGQLLLVRAAAQLKNDGVPFSLTLVGDGEMRPQVEAAIEEHGLASQVEITGWASGQVVAQTLIDSRGLVLPSFAEGLPVVIMEALALGRPALTTYIAGIPELVDAGCGWLVPAGSVDALAEAMKKMLAASPSTLSKLGQEGRRRVLARHDASIATESLYRALCKAGEA